MIIYIDKKSKRIKMVSQKRMDLPQFDIIEASDKDISGRVSFFRSGKIESKIIDPIMEKEDLKSELEDAKTINDLKTIINKLI